MNLEYGDGTNPWDMEFELVEPSAIESAQSELAKAQGRQRYAKRTKSRDDPGTSAASSPGSESEGSSRRSLLSPTAGAYLPTVHCCIEYCIT